MGLLNQMRARPALFAAAACAWALAAGPALAQAPSGNLWQSYMDGALKSHQAGDYKAESVLLNAALAFANQHDAQGQRPAMTRLPLMLAYFELDRQDLVKPLADLGVRIDVGDLDNQIADYIDTVYSYGLSYDTQWGAHKNDKPADAQDQRDKDSAKQSARVYGAKNSAKLGVALRTKLRPDDPIGLASEMAMVGLSYRRDAEFDCVDYDYDRAIQTFLGYQQKRDAMATIGEHFSVGQSMTPTPEQTMTGQAVIDTQVYLVLNAAMALRDSADQTLESHSDQPALAAALSNADLAAKCDNFGPPLAGTPLIGFEDQVNNSHTDFAMLTKLTEALHKDWPDHPFFGTVSYQIAYLFQLEFEWSKTHPGKYPTAVSDAQAAYQQALDILTFSEGNDAPLVRSAASDFVDFLNAANLPDDAKAVAQRYGISAGK